MNLDSDDDSDSKESELSIAGDDVDVFLNHYRIPQLESSNNNPPRGSGNRNQVKYNNEGKIMSLTELAAQKVACHLPFGFVEHYEPPVPEPLQCRIAYWSFPQDEEDVRLYTCLANGNSDVFHQAEELIRFNCVCDILQVGFHLSANVNCIQDDTEDLDCYRVAVTFDRRRITSCSCSCSSPTYWCQHAVAVCLQRIRKPLEVKLRAPVSESLQRLEKNQLQKLIQYLINESPHRNLPPAQKILDELLSGDKAIINQNPAAPDPTAGAAINEQTSWCLDDSHLSMDIRKILLKQCTTQPTVCSDIQALHTTAPPAATDYSQLLRPIRGREPEGLWNLISIVGEMMRRGDSNFFLLLEIITEEVLRCDKIVTWWVETNVSLHSGSTIHHGGIKNNNSQCTAQYSCSNFCDEIVHLWRLAALDPNAKLADRKRLYKKFFDWHLDILKRHCTSNENGIIGSNLKSGQRNILELFPGFIPSMEGCLIDWSDWDEKKAQLASVEEPVVETKPLRASKKRKKKSKAKQIEAEPQPSTSNEKATENQKVEQLTEIKAESKLEKDIIEEHDHELAENMIKENKDHVADEPERREPLQELNGEQQELIVERQEDLQDGPRIEPDLQVYYMQGSNDNPSSAQKPELLKDFIKVNPKKLNDPLETLYTKAEGLYAHGHLEESRKLAHKVTIEILERPVYPNLRQLYNLPRRRKKKGSLDNQMSIVASEALSKIAFLSNVLIDDPANRNLVFRLVLLGVEMKRSPAATKLLEVKLINQKQSLMMFLKSITLHDEELKILREKAQALRDGVYMNISDALTTLILGDYIFEALVLSKFPTPTNLSSSRAIENSRNVTPSSYVQPAQYQLEEHFLPPGDINQQPSSIACDQLRKPCSLIVHGKQPLDTSLGFNAALNAISVKLNVSEVDHPLLCEGTRRQRGELALSLLTHYKDDQEKLDLVLKHLLDKDAVLSPNTPERAVRKNSSPQDVNGPTEASSHFMFELAKTVFDKAGGNITTAHLFRPQLINQNGARGVHRRLHMCTLRIALFSLGLQNRTSVNWMQRTYNGRASFIHEQALEIGLPAIKFLCENWEGYLTPVEVASIADKAVCSNDPETTRVAAELAKSCLKFANYLDFNVVRRILAHCKEQSIEMIEEACNEIERVAGNDSVCSDVLFAAARAWYSLYEKLVYDEKCVENGQSRDNIPSEHLTGASGWHVNSNSHQKDKCPQFDESIHLIPWGVYGRVDYRPAIYTPTYQHINYVKAAYRVGIKALDALKPVYHLTSKHNPKKEDDVVWLLGLSKSLGRDCLKNFSRIAIKSITNAHVLHIICSDLIKFFEKLPDDHEDRVTILLPLLDRCLDRFVKQTRDLMKHISYDQKNHIESILEIAQALTETANTLTAANHYKELLKTIDLGIYSKKTKRSRSITDTRPRHEWHNDLVYNIKFACSCTKCQTARAISENFSTCHQRNC